MITLLTEMIDFKRDTITSIKKYMQKGQFGQITYSNDMDLKYMVSIKDRYNGQDVEYNATFKENAVFSMYQATKKVGDGQSKYTY